MDNQLTTAPPNLHLAYGLRGPNLQLRSSRIAVHQAGNLLIGPGIHAVGSVRAVHPLTLHLADVYQHTHGRSFSMVISSTFNGTEQENGGSMGTRDLRMTVDAATLPHGIANQDRYMVSDQYAAVPDGPCSFRRSASHRDGGRYAEKLRTGLGALLAA